MVFQGLAFFGLLSIWACGSIDTIDQRTTVESPAVETSDDGDVQVESDEASLVSPIIRGVFEIPMGSEPDVALSLAQSASVAIKGTVNPTVTLKLSTDHLENPPAIGVVSYGTVDVVELYDNDMNVCGANGKTRCKNAGLRIYTTGTPKPGLWNAEDSYGAPMQTSARTIRLGQANARILKRISIGSRNVTALKDFSATGPYLVPLTVDYTNAPAGNYVTTLVIEYYLE